MGKIFADFNVDNRGNILLFVMVFGAISFSLIVVSVAGYGISENRASTHKHNREEAFQIAEAGVDYYRWHLAHNKNDYQDGTGGPGPYVHEYKNKDGDVIGRYSLNIIPPASGSTVVTIESTGSVDIQPDSKRTIRVRVGFPALTDYAYLTNTSVTVDANETIHGKFHSNAGIEFNGAADAPVTSAVSSYVCKKKNNRGCSQQTDKPAIWGSGGPTIYWKFPVPSVDINAIVPQISQIKDGAQNGGLYLSSSGAQGWRLEFTSDGKINVYKVLSTDCFKGKEEVDNPRENWSCVDAKTYGLPTIYDIPANGFIYVNDIVWVDGVVKGRATIANKDDRSIIISNNLTYFAKDGANTLGLIGGKNILISYNAPDDLEIDAVILALKGNTKRHYYEGQTKNSLIIYGSVIANQNWYWNWVDSQGDINSGYVSSTLTYDSNLTYNPPPGFPFGSDYNLISWEEVK